jgi:hypothetical protein
MKLARFRSAPVLLGTVRATWVDPSTGGSASAREPLYNAGVRDFTPPENNAEGTTDWLLVLRAS